MTEIERIQKNTNGEIPPPVVKFLFKSLSPNVTMVRIKEVMEIMARYSSDDWPSEEEWSSLLPGWFVEISNRHSPEEIQQNKDLWHYGSWLDAMCHKGWEWWSSSYTDEHCEICGNVHEPIYMAEAMQYLIYAAGGFDIRCIDEMD